MHMDDYDTLQNFNKPQSFTYDQNYYLVWSEYVKLYSLIYT